MLSSENGHRTAAPVSNVSPLNTPAVLVHGNTCRYVHTVQDSCKHPAEDHQWMFGEVIALASWFRSFGKYGELQQFQASESQLTLWAYHFQDFYALFYYLFASLTHDQCLHDPLDAMIVRLSKNSRLVTPSCWWSLWSPLFLFPKQLGIGRRWLFLLFLFQKSLCFWRGFTAYKKQRFWTKDIYKT